MRPGVRVAQVESHVGALLPLLCGAAGSETTPMAMKRLEQDDILRLLASGHRVGAIGTVGSGLWDFEDDFPELFTSLEPAQLREWRGDVLLFFAHRIAAEQADWLHAVDPDFDVSQLRQLPPRTALLYEAVAPGCTGG